MKSNKYCIFFISIKNHQKSLQQFNEVIIIIEENMIAIRDPKTFSFNFDWSKYVNENLKREIEFIIKCNEYLAENKIKNETEQLLLKYNHGNDIHEHGRTNELVTKIRFKKFE